MGLSAGGSRREGLTAASPRQGKDLPAATSASPGKDALSVDAAPRAQQPEEVPVGADTDSMPWDAPRPRLRERFTRAQLVSRSSWAAGGLLIAYAAAAFAFRGMWLDLTSRTRPRPTRPESHHSLNSRWAWQAPAQ